MGKLTRRVKFIAKERRLSIPAEFLHQHGIERGDHLVVAAASHRLYGFSVPAWERYQQVSDQMANWFPEREHPFLSVVRGGIRLRLGSQDRIVLPKTFPFRQETSTKMHWDLTDGVLMMEPELANVPERPVHDEPTGQASLLDLMGTGRANDEHFDREHARSELIEPISVGRVDWRDRTYSEDGASPPESLVRSIKVEGIRRPLVLREREDGSYQVIDGFRRLTAARTLRMRSVPAIVWRGIDDAACARLKLMEAPRERGAEATTLRRLQSTLRLHEDQVALKEIEQITGRRKRTLQRYLRVAQNPNVRDAIESGRLSIFKAEEILKAGIDPEAAIREGWTVRQIREAGQKLGRRRARRSHGRVDE
jgi:ParB/RepB/Spo0J family partition protein